MKTLLILAALVLSSCASKQQDDGCKTKVVGNDHPVRFEQICK